MCSGEELLLQFNKYLKLGRSSLEGAHFYKAVGKEFANALKYMSTFEWL